MNSSEIPQIVDNFLSSVNQKTRNFIYEYETSLPLNSQCDIFVRLFDCIVQKVESFINQQPTYKKIVFSFGITGSGSTSSVLALTNSDRVDLVGDKFSPSRTIVPNCFLKNDIIFIDFPSFNPSQGLIVWMAFETSLQFLFNKHNKKSITLVNFPINSRSWDELNSCLCKLFKNHSIHSILMFTHYDKLDYYFTQKRETIKTTEIHKNETKQQEILKLEKIACKRIGIPNFLRFDDLRNTQLIQENFQYIENFHLMGSHSFKSKGYRMRADVEVIFYPKILDLIQELHFDANITFSRESNRLDLIPLILLDRNVYHSVDSFITHSSCKRFLIKLHKEFIQKVAQCVEYRIKNFLYELKKLETPHKKLSNESDNDLDISDDNKLTNKSSTVEYFVQDHCLLPKWIKNSIKFTNDLSNDLNLITVYVNDLQLNNY